MVAIPRVDSDHLPNQFAPMIDSFVFQANSLLVQFQQLQARIKDFHNNPVRDFLGELGGAVGRDLLSSPFGRTIGKAVAKGYLESQERQLLSQEAQRLDVSLSILLAGIKSFLSSVSVARLGLKASGNSEVLLRRLRRVDEAMRFDTKLRRVVSTLQGIREEPLIYNSSIPQWTEQQKRRDIEEGKAYRAMRQLETNLRSFISSRLGAISSNWWVERVPEDVRQLAEARKTKNERLYPWQSELDLHPIHFVDFADYVKIILRRDNWNQVFSPVFKDKEMISVKLRELEPIRNAISHFRTLSKRQEEKLELYFSDISSGLQA